MTTPDPDFQSPEPTSEASSKPKRKRKTEAEPEAVLVETSPPDADAAKPKRRRKTKGEKEAARLARAKAEAEKPLDPKLWFSLGGILLIIAGFIYVDPVTFAEAGRSTSEGMWIRDVLVIFVGILGKTPTVIILTIIAVLSLGMGVWGWVDARKPKVEKQSDE
jgi:hypothetical protein